MVEEEENKGSTPQVKSSSGMDPKIAGLLCYLFGWISGLIFYLIEKDDKSIRFHALQSILLNVAVIAALIVLGIVVGIIGAIPGLGIVVLAIIPLLYGIFWLGFTVLWIMLMVRAYQGERWKLPVIGDIAEKNA